MRRGTRTGEIYVAASVDGDGINKGIADGAEEGFNDLERQSEPAGERSGERFSAGFRERMSKIADKASARFNSTMGRMGHEAGEQAGERAGKSLVESAAEKVRDLGDKVGKELGDRLASNPEQVRRGIDRAFSDDFADRLASRFADRLGDRLSESLAGSLAEAFDGLDIGKAVSGNKSGSAKSGGFDIGRFFGAGSRNNFLNLFGKTIGNVTNLAVKGTQALQGLAEKSTLLQKAFAGLGGAGGAGKFATMLRGFAASGPVAVAAIVAITAALAVMASVVSALIAIITALASTIVSALAGALAVGTAGLLAMVAAGGLLTAAFMSMTDAQSRALKDAFQPLKAEMVGLGQLMIREMVPAFSVWSDNLQRALFLLEPLARVMGGAFAEAGKSLTASLSGPGFQAMAHALGVYLPSIVARLSRALGGFLNGVMGMFAAIMPMVNRFAGYLADVATRFSNWANSARGRNAIVDFTNRAVESLKSLWNFTREVFGFIGDLLFSSTAQRAGNTIFDSMTNAFKSFREAVARAIANGDLERWFNEGIELGAALWKVVQSLYKLFVALNNSGVLSAVAGTLRYVAFYFEAIAFVARPLVDGLGWVADAFGDATGIARDYNNELAVTAQISQALISMLPAINAAMGAAVGAAATKFKPTQFDLDDLLDLGNSALKNTSIDRGGYKQYKNPYTRWAEQFISDGPSIAKQIKQAVREVTKAFNSALREAADAIGAGEARSLVNSAVQSARDTAQAMVEAARSALSSAAQSLASASSAKDAARALKEVRRMQAALRNALAVQDRIQKAANQLGNQKVVTNRFVERLLAGDSVRRATLADYAEARERLAARIEKANQKLADAIAMRNDYRVAVGDALKEFGSLLTAQGKIIDGVEQALTYGDITENLQARLDKIKTFQDNLRKLLALGLSNAAYKQLVDAGVEQGSAYAEALLAGGQGAVIQVNDLVGQIDSTAEALGKEAANYLYQAGVEAAKGIVKGLESLDAWLGEWADWLGKTIANSIQRALDGKGGKGGGGKGGNNRTSASTDVSSTKSVAAGIAVSPEVARYAASQGRPVSGNGAPVNDIDITVVTPSGDPKAVAVETVNELTGRL